jgi:HlyD family secretion protein
MRMRVLSGVCRLGAALCRGAATCLAVSGPRAAAGTAAAVRRQGAARLLAAAAVVAALAVLAGLAGCRRAGAGDQGAAAAGAAGAAADSITVVLSPPPPSSPALAVRRGDLRPRLLLTGELKSARAETLVAPQTPSFQLQIRWMAEDGARVAAGQPVVEFDNSAFVSKLDEKRLAAAAGADELARLQAEARATAADRAFAVEQARTDLEKARIAAAVPAELLPRREYQDRQLKLQQSETALAKAQADRAAQRSTSAADLGVQRIALDKTRREVAAAEAAIRELTLRAPRAGLMLVGDHPFAGRKLHEGDNVWTGTAVAMLPDLASMMVEAALSDVDDGRVAPGMEATCFLDAYPESPYRGRVAEVSPVARESGRSALLRYFTVRVELGPLTPRQVARLRPGMSARVEIAAPPVRGALLVPRAALELAAPAPFVQAVVASSGPLEAAPPMRPQSGPAGAASRGHAGTLGGSRALLAGGGAAPVRLGPCDAFWCVAVSGVREGQALRRRAAGDAG